MSDTDRSTALVNLLSDNFKTIAALFGGYLIAADQGWIEQGPPDLPVWAELVGMGMLVAILLGVLVGSKIHGMLPEPPRVYLVAQSEDPGGNKIWKLSPDQFADLTVAKGSLYEWTETIHPTYECLDYDRDLNVANATWREGVPASEILGKPEVGDAIKQISEIRGEYEDQARIGAAIRRRIGSIIRRLDRRRAMDQNAAIEGHVAPSLDTEERIDDVIQESIGDLAPDYMSDDDRAKTGESDDFGGEFDILDVDPDVLEPVEPDGGQIRE